jgi:crossover junction endodeoxyribonuclease RusA
VSAAIPQPDLNGTVRALSFTLPWPPSVNQYWRSIRSGRMAGRVLISEAGRAFRKAAIESIGEQHVPVVPGVAGWRMLAVAYAPTHDKRGYRLGPRRRDLDNLLKATLDALTHGGVIADDSLIDDLRIVRGPCCEKPFMHIELEVLA